MKARCASFDGNVLEYTILPGYDVALTFKSLGKQYDYHVENFLKQAGFTTHEIQTWFTGGDENDIEDPRLQILYGTLDDLAVCFEQIIRIWGSQVMNYCLAHMNTPPGPDRRHCIHKLACRCLVEVNFWAPTWVHAIIPYVEQSA